MVERIPCVVWLYSIFIAISVCYPAEDSEMLLGSEVVKGNANENRLSNALNDFACVKTNCPVLLTLQLSQPSFFR